MNGLADNARGAPETPPPVAIADDANRMCARHAIILWRNRSPQRRIYAQSLIIAPAHELAVDCRFRLSIHAHGQPHRMVGQHAGERQVVIPELLVSDVGEADAACEAAEVTEHDKSLWLL